MARLPNPGGDEGTWGNVLNEFLSAIHNPNGTLKDNVVSSSALAPDAVDTANIQDATISEDKLDTALAAKVNALSSGAPDATTSSKGLVQLAGDLGGTAAAPTVPGLSNKADNSAVVHLAGSETVTGVKAFSVSPTVPTPTTNTQVANKAYADSMAAPDATTSAKGIVQLTGDLGGTATSPTVPGLAGKANNNAVVHLSGDETMGGIKTFSSSPIVPTPSTNTQAANKSYVDNAASAAAPDATTSTKGLVQLTGALGGTATAPTVPGLATKEPTITAGTTSQYYRGDKSWQTLDKAAVGLSNVDNTSDINKPISNDVQTALDAKANTTAIGAKVLLIDNAAALPPGTPAGVVVVVKS